MIAIAATSLGPLYIWRNIAGKSKKSAIEIVSDQNERGAFIKAAKQRRRDFTVDWVHLKLNDQAQRTVLCKDPFKAVDERVEKLIESL